MLKNVLKGEKQTIIVNTTLYVILSSSFHKNERKKIEENLVSILKTCSVNPVRVTECGY